MTHNMVVADGPVPTLSVFCTYPANCALEKLKQNIDNKYKYHRVQLCWADGSMKVDFKNVNIRQVGAREVLVECIHSGVLHVLWQLPHMNFSASICIEQSTVSSTDYWSTQEKIKSFATPTVVSSGLHYWPTVQRSCHSFSAQWTSNAERPLMGIYHHVMTAASIITQCTSTHTCKISISKLSK